MLCCFIYFGSLFFVFNLILSSYSLYNLLSNHSFYILTICILIFYIFIEIIIYVFISFFYLSDSYLFYFWASCVSFLIAFFSCFRWNHCFLVFFFCFYLVLSCRFLFHLSLISAVTRWLLVFCIFIYSCNYILVFLPFHRVFFITSLSYVMISCCFSYTPLSLACKIFVLFVVIIFFCCCFTFSAFYSSFSWFCSSVCVIISLFISLII